jgi:hypothetical protein
LRKALQTKSCQAISFAKPPLSVFAARNLHEPNKSEFSPHGGNRLEKKVPENLRTHARATSTAKAELSHRLFPALTARDAGVQTA